MKPLIASLTAAICLSFASYAQRGPAASGPLPSVSPAIGSWARVQHPALAFRAGRAFRSNTPAFWGAPFAGWANDELSGNCCACPEEQSQIPPSTPSFDPWPMPAPPPDPPVRAVIHEYSWPATTASPTTAFTIVLRNGEVKRAAAVWRTDGALNFSGVNGPGGRLTLDSVDFEATRKLNSAAGGGFPLSFR